MSPKHLVQTAMPKLALVSRRRLEIECVTVTFEPAAASGADQRQTARGIGRGDEATATRCQEYATLFVSTQLSRGVQQESARRVDLARSAVGHPVQCARTVSAVGR